MTCVAYRDGVLAADKKSTYYGGGVTTTKIRRMGDRSIAGCSGQGGMCRELLAWYEEGAAPQDYPDRAGTAMMLVIGLAGDIRLFDGSGFALRIEDPYFAVGSGKDAALAAMYLGCDARRAVEVACAIDDGCGRGIDHLELQA